MARISRGVSLLASFLAACGGGGGGTPPDAGAPPPPPDAAIPVAAVFVPPAPGAGASWGTIPFPSDLFLDASGRLTLLALPVGQNPSDAAVDQMKQALRTLDGAGPWTNVYFPVDGDVDPATLAGNVKLVELPAGTELPIDLLYRADLESIIASPRLGNLLRAGRSYAAYVTNGVRDAGGAPLAASAPFLAARDLATVPADPAVAAAQASLRPLLETLPAGTRDTLVSATVFRIADVTRDTVAMRNIVAARAYDATITDVFATPAELDGLFGAQDPAAPPGYSGLNRHQPHGHIAAVIHGELTIDNFVNAAPQTAGFLDHDAAGAPIVKGTEVVRFTMVFPIAASYAATPVLVFGHGVTQTRSDMFVVADTAAARGVATIAIDTNYHGDRAPVAMDVVNNTTGEAIPDGIGDRNALLAPGFFFHLAGSSGGIPAGHPGAMKENLRHVAIDLCSLVAFVRNADPAPINAALAGAGLPADYSPHPRGIGYAAESFGSILGTIAVAVEPELGVAALSVGGAGFPFPIAIHSPGFSGFFVPIAYDPFDVSSRSVIGDPERGYRWEPMTILWNYALAEGDPASYAPFVLSGELRGGSGPSLVVAEAWSDETVSNEANEALAKALGIPTMTTALPERPPSPELRYAPLPEVTAPLSGNLGPTQTAAHTLWHPAAHGLLVYLDDDTVYEPGFPPFVERAAPIPIANPLVQWHTMWSTFVSEYFTGAGAPTLIDPFE